MWIGLTNSLAVRIVNWRHKKGQYGSKNTQCPPLRKRSIRYIFRPYIFGKTCAWCATEHHVPLVKSTWKVCKWHLKIQQLCFCTQIEIPTRRSCEVFYDVPVGSNINKVFTEICCFLWKKKRKSKAIWRRDLLLWSFLVPLRFSAASHGLNWVVESN